MPLITYREALKNALDEEIRRDENVVIIGEEVAQYNGAYKVTEGLWKKHGDKRVVDTPISEAAFIGMGIGAAMLGLRPVLELMFWSFAYVAFDQIVNNAGCIRYMSGGQINLPVVIRGPANAGTNVGATHSHTPENFLANVPGLKVVAPATAFDAKGLMKTAIRDNDPVMVMENTLLYGERWEVPEEEYLIPLGLAEVKRQGTTLSLIAHGRAVLTCLKAADCSPPSTMSTRKLWTCVLSVRWTRKPFWLRCAKPIAPLWWKKTSRSAASGHNWFQLSKQKPLTIWTRRLAGFLPSMLPPSTARLPKENNCRILSG